MAHSAIDFKPSNPPFLSVYAVLAGSQRSVHFGSQMVWNLATPPESVDNHRPITTDFARAFRISYKSAAQFSCRDSFTNEVCPYQQKATIFRRLCQTEIPMFVLFFDTDPLLFSIKIKQHCPHQPWEATEPENRQQLRLLSNHLPILRPEWPTKHPFRIMCKKLLQSQLFHDDLIEYYKRNMYSKAQMRSLAMERQSSQSFADFVGGLPGFVRVSRHPRPRRCHSIMASKASWALSGFLPGPWTCSTGAPTPNLARASKP
jgi:hypothetical protein